MGILSFFANKGSVETTTRWLLDQYINRDLKDSDYNNLISIIKLRYLTIPNDNHKNHLITNLAKIVNPYGLAGLVIEILNLEASFSDNDFDAMDSMNGVIIKILKEDNKISDLRKFGKKGVEKLKVYGEDSLEKSLTVFALEYPTDRRR